VAFGAPQWGWISRLDEVLKTGRGVEIHRTLTGPDWNLYQRAMAEGARDFAAFVARELPVPAGARLCLDVAGSHGLVGAALCRAHPGLKSVVLDRPEAIPEARKLADELGIADVVSFREADILQDDYGEGADVVILANILHHFTPDVNLQILTRARKALRPGGSVGIFDIEAPRPDAPAGGGRGRGGPVLPYHLEQRVFFGRRISWTGWGEPDSGARGQCAACVCPRAFWWSGRVE
jgi:SAM-dependent methyltransferase